MKVIEFPFPEWLCQPFGDDHPACSRAELTAWRRAHRAPEGAMQIKGYQTKLEAWDEADSRHDFAIKIVCWACREIAALPIDAEEAYQVTLAWWRSVAGNTRRNRRTDVAELDAIWRYGVGQLVGTNGDTPAPQVESQLSDAEPEPEEESRLLDFAKVGEHGEDIVEGFLVHGRWTAVAAPAKAGKSSFGLWCGLELAAGRDPFDGDPRDPVAVLWLDGELGAVDLKELIQECGHDPLKLVGFHAALSFRLDRPMGAEELFALVERTGAEVVILDGLNAFVNPGASESDDEPWRLLYETTIRGLKRRHVAVLSNDNLGHQGDHPRGSSVKLDKADAIVRLTRREMGGVRLRTTHRRGSGFLVELELAGEGFDGSKPIRYWRALLAGRPPGTNEAMVVLTSLGIPTDWGRDKVRKRLREEIDRVTLARGDPTPFQIRNEPLSAAIAARKTPAARPVPKPVPDLFGSGPGDSSGDRGV
jgi:hypothetical protein